jgi:hypothetical protein
VSDQLKLITDVRLLKGTQYLEFLPGEYTKVCWNEHSAYLAEDDFNIIEGLIVSVAKDFDHFAFQTWDSDLIRQLIAELRAAAAQLVEAASPDNVVNILLTKNARLITDPNELYSHRTTIAEMMCALSNWLENTCQSYDRISILGI